MRTWARNLPVLRIVNSSLTRHQVFRRVRRTNERATTSRERHRAEVARGSSEALLSRGDGVAGSAEAGVVARARWCVVPAWTNTAPSFDREPGRRSVEQAPRLLHGRRSRCG